ncbi:MAG: hypothetical protein AAGU12_11080 [Clostridiales bacterium]
MPEAMAITAQELDELYRSLQERQAKEGVVFVHGAGKQKPTLQKVMKPGEDWRLPKRAKNKKGGCPSSALFSAVLRHPFIHSAPETILSHSAVRWLETATKVLLAQNQVSDERP